MTSTFEIKETGKTIMFVGLPKHTYTIFLSENQLIVRRAYEFHQEQDEVDLPNGDWILLGTMPGLDEGKLEGVMDGLSAAQLGGVYYSNGVNKKYCYETATEALQSLMQHLGLPDGNYGVLIK